MTRLSAAGFPEAEVRARAREGARRAFPPLDEYGTTLLGGRGSAPVGGDPFDALRIVPPIFTPRRLEKLIELAREPLPSDVDLAVSIGGFRSSCPVYVSAFGSTRAAGDGLGAAVARQAGRLGLPLVIGENIVPVTGYGRLRRQDEASMLLDRIRAYAEDLPAGLGGVVVQQSTEDADAEVWNLVYSDPNVQSLADSGRLGFELKLGQGAKPGLGGMTVVDRATQARLGDAYAFDDLFATGSERVMRSGSPGTFTAEILRNQIRFMRNNYPRSRIWVKMPPVRDIREAAEVARTAGADAVTVDGGEGGSGWAPTAFIENVGLPLGECLVRVAWPSNPATTLLASGRMWEGTRAVKAFAMGAGAVGLGRAALLAADECGDAGLVRLVECLTFEMRLLISALGKYDVSQLDREDLWSAQPTGTEPAAATVATDGAGVG
ncbi:glutamate synthase-related protein [Micromonospora phytophila]|uniref:glutamate synthase-related protein n=1 Tax=Micromonospora phytophila TaxID=709888 RepID=UPI00202F60FF|nr:glutamate synthase-related protein [Micromonospora phytophila]MCM0675155.1 glutamate synthase-related protein [Micromonospora phytophila]